MRAVVQRVLSAHISVADEETGRIGAGLLIFLGVGRGDNESDADWLAARLLKLRVFESEPRKMDRSVTDMRGECMVIEAKNDGPVTLVVDTKARNF